MAALLDSDLWTNDAAGLSHLAGAGPGALAHGHGPLPPLGCPPEPNQILQELAGLEVVYVGEQAEQVQAAHRAGLLFQGVPRPEVPARAKQPLPAPASWGLCRIPGRLGGSGGAVAPSASLRGSPGRLRCLSAAPDAAGAPAIRGSLPQQWSAHGGLAQPSFRLSLTRPCGFSERWICTCKSEPWCSGPGAKSRRGRCPAVPDWGPVQRAGHRARASASGAAGGCRSRWRSTASGSSHR